MSYFAEVGYGGWVKILFFRNPDNFLFALTYVRRNETFLHEKKRSNHPPPIHRPTPIYFLFCFDFFFFY